MRHLCKVSQRGHETGMTSKNLSIVWAPNLLRSRADDGFSKAGGCTNLKDIGLQVFWFTYWSSVLNIVCLIPTLLINFQTQTQG
jgi:hypothetical protein